MLRSLYGFEESEIGEALTKRLGLENVCAEDESSVATALSLAAHGIELADAMHLSGTPPDARFLSFDKLFVRRARRAGVSAVSGIPA